MSLQDGRGGPRRRTSTEFEPDGEALITGLFEGYLKPAPRRSAAPQSPVRLPPLDALYLELKHDCKAAGVVKVPSRSTLARRLREYRRANLIVARRRRHVTRHGILAPVGQDELYPGATEPLSLVQIDHSWTDVMVVDDHEREPIGRLWITVAIDVFSRMILGHYVSLDPPSGMSVALCVAQAICPKEKYLRDLGVPGEWPCWGFPVTVHTDNAREFRSKALVRALSIYGCGHEYRPTQHKEYGAHIERLIGTNSQLFKQLAGTTMANVKERGSYDSKRNAAFARTEFEAYLTDWIVNFYHRRLHKGIGTSPLARWLRGINGDDSAHPGTGWPMRPTDPARLVLDFTPWSYRTVHNATIQWGNIAYSADALAAYSDIPDPEHRGRTIQYRCHLDPRDVSVIHFFAPDKREYIPIGYKTPTRPRMSKWEREAAAQEAKENDGQVSEDALFEALQRLRRRESEAVERTGSTRARRNLQRRRDHEALADTTPRPEHAGANESVSVARPLQARLDVGQGRPTLTKEPILPSDDLDEMPVFGVGQEFRLQ